MLVILPRLRRRISFTALFLAFLSIAVIVVTPVSLDRNISAAESSVGLQKADISSRMTTAMASLQSGQGPLGIGPVSCSAGGPGSAYCATAQNGQAASTSSAVGSWANITPSPHQRYAASMVYDTADGYVILFGGFGSLSDNAPLQGDTWKFLAGSWTNITSTSGPSPRSDSSMAFDAVDGYVILFGGTVGHYSGSRVLGDTWKFLGGSWTNITSSTGPFPRSFPSMAFDVADGYVILFGGQYQIIRNGGGRNGALNDTWKFLAGSWTNITSSAGPPPIFGTSMVYDAADGYMVLVGACCAIQGASSDTWKFLGGSWTNITSSTGPSPRGISSMVYDGADGYVMLFGAITNPGPFVPLDNTWKFVGGSWTNITSSTGPFPRDYMSMAFDAVDGYVILFGGVGSSGLLVDTWKFIGGSWTNITPSPSPRYGSPMVYDTADGYVVLFGGFSSSPYGYIGDTWKFLGGSWTNITPSSGPSPRYGSSMAFDAADGYVILFSGNDGLHSLGDTWKFLGGSWTNITPTNSPSPRYDASTVYDAADRYVILFGGFSNSPYGAVGDTWKFLGGSWTNITPTNSPSPRYDASTVYDAADGYLILFGGQSSSGYVGDTWKFLGGSWTNITPSSGPPPRSLASMVYDGADGYVILFGGQTIGNLGGYYGDTWKYVGGSWTNIASSSGPSPRWDPAMVFDAADGYVVLFGGQASGYQGSSGETWKFSSISTPPMFDYSLSNNGPVTITAGSSGSVTITATLTADTAEPVTLSCAGSSLASGITCGSLTVNPVTPTSTSASSILSVNVAASAAPGSYSFMVTGSPLGVTTIPTTVTVAVLAIVKTSTSISVSCSPSSINVGSFTTCTATMTGSSPSGQASFTTSSSTGHFTPSTSTCTLSTGACSITYTDTASSNSAAVVSASYPGDAYNTAATGTFSLAIVKPSTILVTATSSVTINSGTATADQTSTTGISVQITGSTATNGTPAAIDSQDLSSPSTGVGTVSLSGAKYYDVVVSGVTSGTAKVCINDPSATSGTTMQYWTGTAWTSASSVTVNGGTVCGNMPVSALTGTNVAVGNTIQPAPLKPTILGLDPTLFYEIVGALVAIMIVAVALVYRRSRKPNRQVAK